MLDDNKYIAFSDLRNDGGGEEIPFISYHDTQTLTDTQKQNVRNKINAESTDNKVNSVTSGSTNTQYPSAKATYTAIKTANDNEIAARESAVNAEANARSQADTSLDNNKQNKLNTAAGWSSSGNIVLVAIGGSMQWKPFNNILAGSTTPIDSEGNNGDIYIQTE